MLTASTELLLTIESMNDSKLIHNENLANIEENFMNASVESKKAKSKKKKVQNSYSIYIFDLVAGSQRNERIR